MQDLQIVHTDLGQHEGVFKLASLRFLMGSLIFSIIIEFIEVDGFTD
jgi:hypothetical protein